MGRPNPKGYDFKGGSEDWGFLRTLDGHCASDRFATGEDIDGDREGRNVAKDHFLLSEEDYVD